MLFSQPVKPEAKRAAAGSTSPVVVNANELLKKRTMSGQGVIPNPTQPRDFAIVAFVNFCCAESVITSPEKSVVGMSYPLHPLFPFV